MDLTSQTTTPLPTGLDELLRRWGAPVAEGLVWDQGRSNTISLNEAIDVGGQERRGREVSLAYPLWPNVGEDGLASDLPVTGGVNGVDLFWVQPVLPSELVPRNVKRQPLLSSTDLSWIVEPEEALVLDPQQLDAKAANLLAGGKGRTMELAVSLRGRFPSATSPSGA